MSASVIRHALALAERTSPLPPAPLLPLDTDGLWGVGFEAIHRHSVAQVRAGPGAGDVDAGVRDTLGAWEACVAAMLDALYAHPDLARLSDLFHVRTPPHPTPN